MSRFRIKKSMLNNNKVSITGSDFNHMVKVLRLKTNDEVILFTDDKEYEALITDITANEVKLNISKIYKSNKESKLDINLFQGLIKASKMELIVQKCTELGVKSITPVINERSQFKQTGKIQRWKRITEEACKQCGRNKPLIINEPVFFSNLVIPQNAASLNISFNTSSENHLKTFVDHLDIKPNVVNIFIGPEGGFNEKEIDFFAQRGVYSLNMGPRTLRSETAAISSVTLIQYILGDL